MENKEEPLPPDQVAAQKMMNVTERLREMNSTDWMHYAVEAFALFKRALPRWKDHRLTVAAEGRRATFYAVWHGGYASMPYNFEVTAEELLRTRNWPERIADNIVRRFEYAAQRLPNEAPRITYTPDWRPRRV